MIVPRVWYWQIFSNWSVLTSNSLSVSVLSVSEKEWFSSSFFWRDKISHPKFVSFDFILAFFSFAYLSELERISIFMVSQRSTGSTSLLLLYSFATSAIVFLITFTYSLSDKNEVFSFQKPGPLGLLLFARWSVMREWSVLYPAKISAFVTAGLKLALVKKKSKRQCISAWILSPPSKSFGIWVKNTPYVYQVQRIRYVLYFFLLSMNFYASLGFLLFLSFWTSCTKLKSPPKTISSQSKERRWLRTFLKKAGLSSFGA